MLEPNILKILIIDDDEDDSYLLQKLIRKGFEQKIVFELITDCQEGAVAIGKSVYHICFLDYLLGEKTGLDILKQTRLDKKSGPIIILTGQGDEKIAVEMLKAGATDYLTKGNLSSYRIGTTIRMAIKIFNEAQDRIRAEAALKESEQKLIQANIELEDRVKARTQELETSNKILNERSNTLDELNTTLKVLLKKKDETQIELEERMVLNIKQLVWPYIQKLKLSDIDSQFKKTIIENIEYNLNEITSSLATTLTSKEFNFTPAQIDIVNHIKQGKTSKEIADILNLSKGTIDTHRDNIRIKLGIKNKKLNLRSYLNAFK